MDAPTPPYDQQRDMLQQLADMKRLVELGEVEGIVILARRTDGDQHIWITKMKSTVLAGLSFLLQAKTLEFYGNIEERPF